MQQIKTKIIQAKIKAEVYNEIIDITEAVININIKIQQEIQT